MTKSPGHIYAASCIYGVKLRAFARLGLELGSPVFTTEESRRKLGGGGSRR